MRCRGHWRAGLYPTDSSRPSSRLAVSSPTAPRAIVPETSTAVIAESYASGDGFAYRGASQLGVLSDRHDHQGTVHGDRSGAHGVAGGGRRGARHPAAPLSTVPRHAAPPAPALSAGIALP